MLAVSRHVVVPNETIGAIYQEITSDEPWRQALEQLRMQMRATNLMLRIGGTEPRAHDAIFAYGPKVDQSLVGEWERHIYREIFPHNPAVGETIIFRWEDVLKPEQYARYLQPYESSWTIIHCFGADKECEFMLIGSREEGETQFNDADTALLAAAGGHFRRALGLRREFLQLRLAAQFQGEGLDRMGISALIIDRDNRAVALNTSASDLVPGSIELQLVNERLFASDPYDDRRLQAAIRQVLASTTDKPRTRLITLPSKSGKRDLGIVLQGRICPSPVSGKPDMNLLAFVRNVDAAFDISSEVTRELFGFTPAEARLAAGLARGRLLRELEVELNISHNTARAHLRAIFDKADVSRQSQLVFLLANCVAPLAKQ